MSEQENYNPELEKPEARLEKDFARLQKIAEVLKEMGFHVIESAVNINRLNDPDAIAGIPLVRDGLNAIRYAYSKSEGLKIWFTNAFADPQNPERQAIEKRLRQEGLL